MSASLTATELRRDIYRVLDRVLQTGRPQEIVRQSQRLLIVPAEPKRRSFDDVPKRRARACSVDELVETSWEKAWNREG
jgi:hypothetical protein